MPTLMHELAFASPPHPLQPLACLRGCTTLQIYASNATLTPPYAFCHPLDPLRHLPSFRLHSALPTFLQHCPHTGLILNTAYHPYAPPFPQVETKMSPPISALTTPYASTPPPHLLHRLQSLCSPGTLKICLQCCPQPPLCLLSVTYHA
ncbi:hypothetical protein O181_004241 [Austropuccinia psidii MF-1]|uniref:Uncharacterized protein n=1 Tax=Austropuccinia psidii MF-1 TaxID=1389203 RepID=A0A9Q3BGH5_9BASI|nr:hypothetical protein [Austropuccinia psidii MF-1]